MAINEILTRVDGVGLSQKTKLFPSLSNKAHHHQEDDNNKHCARQYTQYQEHQAVGGVGIHVQEAGFIVAVPRSGVDGGSLPGREKLLKNITKK